MVRYRRNFVPGGSYSFTVTLADRTSSALVHHVNALRTAFRIARHERPFTIEAIVILPEHLHTIWTPPSGDADFSGRWKQIKAHFTHRLIAAGVPVKRHRNGEYALWQRRFWGHTIRNEIDLERHIDYVHFNPVKHKLVGRARHWPYSSFHVYVRRGLLPATGQAMSKNSRWISASGGLDPGFRFAPSGLLAATDRCDNACD